MHERFISLMEDAENGISFSEEAAKELASYCGRCYEALVCYGDTNGNGRIFGESRRYLEEYCNAYGVDSAKYFSDADMDFIAVQYR